MEARDEKRLRTLQKHLINVKLLIIDELGYGHLLRLVQNFYSKCSVAATNMAPPWSHQICRLMNGQVFWDRNDWPAHCSIAWLIMYIFWKWMENRTAWLQARNDKNRRCNPNQQRRMLTNINDVERAVFYRQPRNIENQRSNPSFLLTYLVHSSRAIWYLFTSSLTL